MQFIESNVYLTPDYYYFIYECEDGLVQIEIVAEKLDNDDIAIIDNLNIY